MGIRGYEVCHPYSLLKAAETNIMRQRNYLGFDRRVFTTFLMTLP